MPSPSYEQRICAMFDSFSKTVSRNFVRNLDRAEKNRKKHYDDEPIDYILELWGKEDSYPSDRFVFYVDSQPCPIENEILYQALLALPKKQREVLLLDFWGCFTDKEIAERLEVTPRTVYNLRQRAFSRVREFYEKRGRDP